METENKKYQDGFNSGYLLAQHEPELIHKILASTKDSLHKNDFLAGLSTGHDTFVTEKNFEQKKGHEIPLEKVPKEILEPEQIYLKGFNSGYLLSKYEPALAKKLITPQAKANEYQKGLAAGKQEYEIEKTRQRLKGISRNITPLSKNIKKDKGKSK